MNQCQTSCTHNKRYFASKRHKRFSWLRIFFFFEFPHNNEQHQTHSTMNNRNNIDDKEHIKRREHNSYYFLSLSHSVQGQTFENEKSTFMEYIIDETLFYDPRAEHLARRRCANGDPRVIMRLSRHQLPVLFHYLARECAKT